MRVFDVEIEAATVDQIAAHGERDYPIEACGLVFGQSDDPRLSRVVPMKNVQDKYHRLDPEAFPRDGRDAFRLDELERLRVLDDSRAKGLVERILYHSHCDAGAYFSPEDRAMAVQQGVEMMPGVVHVVVSIRRGRRADMAAFRFDPARGVFEEKRIAIDAGQQVIPELELRMMEGREAARPIRPVGGVLAPRRVTAEERLELGRHAEKVQIRLDDKRALDDLRRLELGLLSPLSGFARVVEERSIEQSGRLLSGTPWRTPVLLEIQARKSAILPPPGSLVELLDAEGKPSAAIGLSEVVRSGKELVRLAGPVYVYESKGIRDAAEVRAELLRRGMRRVLAIGRQFEERVKSGADMSEFDGVLTPFDVAIDNRLELPLVDRDPWLDAVIAQNLGATHIWVEDGGLARIIEESLAIAPWQPRKGSSIATTKESDLRILEADSE
jgi:proteasome lid subunit RPN8/RPN11